MKRMPAIWPGKYFLVCEEVAEAAFEMCQWLDEYEGDFQAGRVSGHGISDEAWRAHQKLHDALEPYEQIRYGGKR